MNAKTSNHPPDRLGQHEGMMRIAKILAKYKHPTAVRCVCRRMATCRDQKHIGVIKKAGKVVPNGWVQYSCSFVDCDSRAGGYRITRTPSGEQFTSQTFGEYSE